MSAIKDGRYPIMLDQQRHLLFSLNVLDELQDRAGGYDKLNEFLYPNGSPDFKNLKWLLATLVNEGADKDDELVSEQYLGKLIHTGNLNEIIYTIFNAFAKGSNGDENLQKNEDETDMDEDEKNAMSGKSS